jgi:hypothetical protein
MTATRIILNDLWKINPAEVSSPWGRSSLAHPDKAVAVESVTPEGNRYTFATIFRNKHGRSNLQRVGGSPGLFLAGGKSHTAVLKYARTVDPNTTERVFIGPHGFLQKF